MQAQLMTLGRFTAIEKVGSFLIEIAGRQSEMTDDRVMLPISRYDIADYLGLSVETVSRAMTNSSNAALLCNAYVVQRVRVCY
jgi:CRP/FNR family nitrogen fixation transcriptional regulator